MEPDPVEKKHVGSSNNRRSKSYSMPGTCSHSMTGTISLLVLSHSWISRLEFSEKHTHMFIGAHMVKHAKAIKQKPYVVLYYLRVAINNG